MKYKLEIIDDKGSVFTVLGGEELREVARDWIDQNFEPVGRFVVRGVGDTTRQPPITIALDPDTVKGLILEEL